MLRERLRKDYRECYERSAHRERIRLLANKLHDLEYLDVVVVDHVHEWLRFTEHCGQLGIQIPFRVRSPVVDAYVQQRLPGGSASRHRFIRASIRIFIEADENGDFRRKLRTRTEPGGNLFENWAVPYLAFLKEHRCVSEKTLRRGALALGRFMEFLESGGIGDLKQLTAAHVHDFCSRRPDHHKPITWSGYVGYVRRLLKHAFAQGMLPRDLSAAAAGCRQYRDSGLHDVLCEAEVERLLSSTDRSSGIGRRDYALLLLAARYGLRPADIRGMQLEDIRWREGAIVIQQSKTGRKLTLPLLQDVSEAMISCLRNGRPPTKARNVFVRHRAPFEPYGVNNNFSSIARKAMRNAGLQGRPGRKGLYLLRHTLATRLLDAEVPVKTIGDVLGHASADSTLGYMKVDVRHLRAAAISIAEVLQ